MPGLFIMPQLFKKGDRVAFPYNSRTRLGTGIVLGYNTIASCNVVVNTVMDDLPQRQLRMAEVRVMDVSLYIISRKA